MGNRFRGGIRPGAMPALHRWLGNPVLSGLGRLFFRAPVGDFHCGLRGFERAAYERLGLQTTGMEFASEMVIAASLGGLRIADVPVVLHPDGRSRRPHLRTWRDGWRHLRFMLLYSPDWLFLLPGLTLFAGGLLALAWIATAPRPVAGVVLDIHTLLLAGFLVILGFQVVVFALSTKLFAQREGFLPGDPRLQRLAARVRLEHGLLIGAAAAAAGLGLLAWAVSSWSRAGFGELNPRVTMRQVVPAVVLLVLGAMHFSNLYVFSRMRKRALLGDALSHGDGRAHRRDEHDAAGASFEKELHAHPDRHAGTPARPPRGRRTCYGAGPSPGHRSRDGSPRRPRA